MLGYDSLHMTFLSKAAAHPHKMCANLGREAWRLNAYRMNIHGGTQITLRAVSER